MKQTSTSLFPSRWLGILLSTAACLLASTTVAMANEYYELREYQLQSEEAGEKLDGYLQEALIPACERLGTGPVGVFKPAEEGAEGSVRFVLIPVADLETVAQLPRGREGDDQYRQAAESYLALSAEESGLLRIRSELLHAFDCQPELKLPSQGQDQRIFEMRTYESPTPRKGDLKVEMFNSGEVPIFLDCGIEPVFFGQAIIGDRMPNLTYMTVYDDLEALQTAWKKFPQHPDWLVLKEVPKYQKTVSKIQKWLLVPTEYSQI